MDLPPEQDWPPERESFNAEREHLEKTHRELEAAVQALPDGRLNENVNGDRGYSYYFLLHGVIQHNLYHAGQIAILKKALA